MTPGQPAILQRRLVNTSEALTTVSVNAHPGIPTEHLTPAERLGRAFARASGSDIGRGNRRLRGVPWTPGGIIIWLKFLAHALGAACGSVLGTPVAQSEDQDAGDPAHLETPVEDPSGNPITQIVGSLCLAPRAPTAAFYRGWAS